MQSDAKSEREAYIAPQVRTLTVEQARQFLADPASRGDQWAMNLLEFLNQGPQHNEQPNQV
jgi:hypothetical protein